jgi:hypothetical protein
MPLAMLEGLLTVHRPDPLTISGLLDVLGLLRISAAVETHISVPLANARHCGQIIGNRDLDVPIPMLPAWPCDNVINSFSHCYSSRSEVVLYTSNMAEYASYS